MKAIKLLSILLALGVLLAALTACEDQKQQEVKPVEDQEEVVVNPVDESGEEVNDIIDGMPNPVVQYDSVEDAVMVVGHLSPLPTIYEKYNKEASVISGSLIQIVYSDDQDGILVLREQRGTEKDISGSYELYPYESNIDVNGVDVAIKGDSGDSIILATWNDGAYAHSINYKTGHSVEEVVNVVSEING